MDNKPNVGIVGLGVYLPKKKMSVDIEHDFKPEYVPTLPAATGARTQSSTSWASWRSMFPAAIPVTVLRRWALWPLWTA